MLHIKKLNNVSIVAVIVLSSRIAEVVSLSQVYLKFEAKSGCKGQATAEVKMVAVVGAEGLEPPAFWV